MATRFTAATTRTATAAAGKHPRRNLLQVAQVIASPETQLKYRIERLLGQGGFGQAYLARRLGRSTLVPDIVCIKVSQRIDGWLREAYFGQLLDGHARAIRVFDTFPLIHHDEAVMYCLALEYAPHGDLSAFLRRHDRSCSLGEADQARGLLQQVFDVVDHFLPAVGSDFHDTGVHTNSVFRAGFHTESAKDTNA